jgi:hypothetical protein
VSYPLYHDEIDLPSHIEKLRKASLSKSDLSIKVSRVWGTKRELSKYLSGNFGDKKGSFFVVQIFTRV